MKKLLFILFVFYFSLHTFSQGLWTQRASLPAPSRGWAIGLSIGNMGYAGLGSNISIWYRDFWQFDPATNSWTQKADFPGKGTEYPAHFVIGHKVYLVCGADSSLSNFYNECWEYDANDNIWTKKSNFPGASRTWAFGFSIGKKGFIGAGNRNGTYYYKDFWEYDTATDIWTRKADFGGIARGGACGFSVNGNGYVCFGQDSTFFPYLDLWKYDTSSNTWIQKASCPSNKDYYGFSGAAGFVIGSNIYVGVAQSYDTANLQYDYTKTFWKYNTLINSWSREASFIGNGRVLCSAFAIADSGYLGLGIDSSSSATYNDWYRFYPDTLTAINEVSHPKDFIAIYPNPVTKILNLNINGLLLNPLILIKDITGREVYKSHLSFVKSKCTIDISSLSSGIYCITIMNKDLIITQKFIKQ